MPVVSKYKYQSPQPMDKCIREHGQRFETDWTCERHLNSCHIFHLEIIYTCSNLTKISIDKKKIYFAKFKKIFLISVQTDLKVLQPDIFDACVMILFLLLRLHMYFVFQYVDK